MPRSSSQHTQSVETDSRTSAVGRKRTAATIKNSGDSQRPSKRHRSNSKSSRASASTVGAESLRDFVSFSSLQGTDFAQGRSNMAESRYGRNRLQSGFVAARRIQRSASHPGTPEDSEDDSSPLDASHPDVHDLDTTDDDGGMILNVDGSGEEPIVISDDETEDGESDEGQRHAQSVNIDNTSEEEGEYVEKGSTSNTNNTAESNSAHQPAQPEEKEDEPSFVIDLTPGMPQVCLKDLNPDQLQDQIKYAFWHLQRDEIDLSRPVRCLHCQAEGHIDESCPEKTCSHCGVFGEHMSALCPIIKRCSTCRERGHDHCNGMRNTTIPCDICSLPGHTESDCVLRHYPESQLAGAEKLELWISCCSCASKSHLVGDCPKLASKTALRWSLRGIDPDKIINLSIQKSTDKLVKDAQNKGMRPEGLKIRGRANRHNADSGRREDTDSDDIDFFSHTPNRNDNRGRPPPVTTMGRHQVGGSSHYREIEDRYDRFAASSDTYRPPRNAYYATDSFGRPRSRSRSRSPPRFGFHLGGRRSPSPSSSFDSYRPSQRYRPSPPPRRPNQPLNSGRGPSNLPPKPAPGNPIQLPTRKGSNTSMNIKGAAAAAASTGLPPRPPVGSKKKPRRGGKAA